ncbi:MAG: Transcriptional regulator [Rhizorhabdus sp.]|nr:Transcriptional regulator [Rhizorhabdus sp.]
MYEAAANGFGVTLAVPLITERFLQGGRLAACTMARASTELDYSLFYVNPAIRQRPVVREFIDWLRAEALESQRGFDRWYEMAAA